MQHWYMLIEMLSEMMMLVFVVRGDCGMIKYARYGVAWRGEVIVEL